MDEKDSGISAASSDMEVIPIHDSDTQAELAFRSEGDKSSDNTLQVMTQHSEVGDQGSKDKGDEASAGEKQAKTGKQKRRERRLKNEPQSFIGLGEGPSGVQVLDFAEARATELKAMVKALESKGGGKRPFQDLPRHMRRRAMSHNPKRLPRHMRESAAKQMEAEDKAKKRKPPSRQQKRKISSLREEYLRRQNEWMWLETHLWHAKRMKMVNRYGFRLAEHCSDKGIRAAYKSLVHGCLLSDISYYHCNEVSGQQRAIITCLHQLFDIDTGLTLQAKAYLKGQREGKAILYKAGSYPYGAIAPVQFLWQAPLPKSPASENGESASTRHNVTKLWVWCHPAAQKQVLSELMNAIDLYNQTNEVASENDLFSSQSRVSIASRNLIRFRLIGPRSHALLMETLKPAWNDGHIPPEAGTEHENVSDSEICRTSSSDYDFDSEDDSFMINEGISLPPAVKWWSGELEPALDVHFNALAANYQAIRSAPGPAHFSRGAVIGLCVQDPRLYMPSKKTDMVSSHYPRKPRGVHAFSNSLSVEEEEEEEEEVPSSQDDDERDVNNYHQSNGVVGSGTSSSVGTSLSFSMLNDLPVEISFSSLWDVSLCDSLSKSKIPDHLLNRKRSEKLIKSPVLNLGDSAPRIPVLLIQQTLKASKLSQPTNGSLGVGWDLILPQNWAMAFWVSLIYRGARACGMEELQKCGFESQVLDFPCDFPDTDAGEQYNSEQKKELERQYMLKPPDKRLNYGKLLVSAPFHFPWEELVRYWSKRHRIGFDLGGKKRPLESFEVDVPHKKSKLEVNGEIYEHKSSSSSDDSLETMINTESTDISASHRFYVLRSREVLSSLNQLITSIFPSRNPFSSLKSLTANDILQSAIQKYDIDSKHLTSLVAVRVEVVRSGTISCLDSLSLPSPTDLRCFLSSSFPRSFSGPEEEINQRGLTFVGKKLVFSGISSLSRKGMKEVKKRKKGTFDPEMLIKDFQLHPLRPSRLTIGRVTSAGYRLTSSTSCGLGFVTFGGLVQTVLNCHSSGVPNLLCLARGTRSKYYFVKLNLIG